MQSRQAPQVVHIDPAAPHAESTVPAKQVEPFQQPAQHAPA
jgi:hypothetical protein